MSDAELSAPIDAAAFVPPPSARLAALAHEGVRYLLVSGLALGLDWGILVALTEIGRLHYLVSSTVSYCVGAVAHYGLSVRLVFRTRRLTDRRAEFVGFFATGLFGLAVTQSVLWLCVNGLGFGYMIGKIAAVGISFVMGFLMRKVLLFTSAE
jgi:putative flippase GtrA